MKRKIIITGASGLVGQKTAKRLSKKKEYTVYAVGSSKKKLEEIYRNEPNIEILTNESLLSGEMDCLDVTDLIHSAYTRTNDFSKIRTSVAFTKEVFSLCGSYPHISILHLSSRGVYQDPLPGRLNTEDSVLLPASPYKLSKYTCELMLELMCKGSGNHYANLRLSSVNETLNDHALDRPINLFVQNMIEGQNIVVEGGQQVLSYIAAQDVTGAIEALLDIDSQKWHQTYNIGTQWLATATLLEIAEKVREIGVSIYGLKPVELKIEKNDISANAGLDISRIAKQTGWQPQCGYDEMIKELYEIKLKIAITN